MKKEQKKVLTKGRESAIISKLSRGELIQSNLRTAMYLENRIVRMNKYKHESVCTN